MKEAIKAADRSTRKKRPLCGNAKRGPRKDLPKREKTHGIRSYFIQTMESDPKYALNFVKLRDSNTTLFEKKT